MGGPDSRDALARRLRAVGALLLTVGGLVLVLAGLTWGRRSGSSDSVDLWTGLLALAAGILFGLPLIRERRDR